MKQIRIILAESSRLFRQLLIPALYEQHIDTIAEAETGAQLIQLIDLKLPDVVLLEMGLCDIQAFLFIKNRYPRLKIILINSHSADSPTNFLYEHQTEAILSKNTDMDTMIDRIRKVHYNRYMNEKRCLPKENNILFSQRETELIPLIMDGKSNREIAKCMNICDKAVEAHKKNIFKKTKTKGTITFILFAIRQGLYYLK